MNASTQTDITFEHIMALAKLRPLTPPVPDTCPFLLSDRYASILSPKALFVCHSLWKVGIRKSQTHQKLAVSGTCSQLCLEIFPHHVSFQLVLSCPCCSPPSYAASWTLESDFPRYSKELGSTQLPFFSLPFKAQTTSQGNNFSHRSCQKASWRLRGRAPCSLMWVASLSPSLAFPVFTKESRKLT